MNTRKIIGNIGVGAILLFLAFTFVLFFYPALSPLYSVEGADSSVFKLMGQVILKGKVPYLDIFDHKGPLLYFIEAIGLLIGERSGLFVLAVIALFVSIICWYKSARIFLTPLKSAIVVGAQLLTYYYMRTTCNVSEDWNLPFISIAFFLLLSYITNRERQNILFNGFVIGFCMACSFFIRPNDAVAFVGIPVFGACVWMLSNRDILLCLKWCGAIAFGFVVITSIFVIWFAIHNALSELWYGLIGYNSKYAAFNGGFLRSCLKYGKVVIVPLLITILVSLKKVESEGLKYVLLPTMVAAYVLLGAKAYPHYWITWIPVLYLMFWILTLKQTNFSISIVSVCVYMLTISSISCINWIKTPILMCREIETNLKYVDTLNATSHMLFEQISDIDKDSIWSYNLSWHGVIEGELAPNTLSLLVHNDIVPSNRVPLIFMADVDTSLYQYMDIKKAQPKYIIYSKVNNRPYSYRSLDSMFIDENYHVYNVNDKGDIILYKRNTQW